MLLLTPLRRGFLLDTFLSDAIWFYENVAGVQPLDTNLEYNHPGRIRSAYLKLEKQKQLAAGLSTSQSANIMVPVHDPRS